MNAGQSDTGSPYPGPHHNRQGTQDTRDTDRQERHNLRRLHIMMQLLLSTIAQDRSMTVEQAAQLAADTRSIALRMFPGKESTFNMLCRPRIQRAMRERFHIQ